MPVDFQERKQERLSCSNGVTFSGLTATTLSRREREMNHLS